MSKKWSVIISLLLAVVVGLQATLLFKVDRLATNMFNSDSGTLQRIDRIQSSIYGLQHTLDELTEANAPENAADRQSEAGGLFYEAVGSHYVIHGCDAAMLDWDPAHGSLYFADPAFWGEKFSGVGIEGSADWADTEKNKLSMQFTVSSGQSVTGAVDGLRISCTVDVSAGTLVSRMDSVPSAGGTVMELSDAELVDIAVRTAEIMVDAGANAR